MSALVETQQIVAGHMDDILKCFKAGAKITVLVRFPDKPNSDFMMTDDDPAEAIAMIQRRQAAGEDAGGAMNAFEEAHSELARGGNWKQVDLGRENLAAVREYFSSHLCATNRECAAALGLSVMAVGRHVKTIRAEWTE